MATRKSAPKPAAAPPPPMGKRGQPKHEPTEVDRNTVSLMVAGGIAQADIARVRDLTVMTLRKHYKKELATGAATLNSIVILEHVKRIKAGDFQAIKWWEQSRMGWREHIVVDDGKPADTPMRVIVEFVGDAGAPRVEPSTPRNGSWLPDDIRRTCNW